MQDAAYPKPDPWSAEPTQRESTPQRAPGDQPAAPDPSADHRSADQTGHQAAPRTGDQTAHQAEDHADPGAATLELQNAPPADAAVPEWAPPVMMLMGLVLLSWLMLRSFVRRGQRAGEPSEPRERIEAIRRQAGARAQIDSYSADAQELTQRLAAQLDAKAARIQILLEEADDAVRRLERARRALDGAPRIPEPRLAQQEPHADDNPLAGEVYRLADEGHSTLEIAQRLKQHVGQVELMLALRRA